MPECTFLSHVCQRRAFAGRMLGALLCATVLHHAATGETSPPEAHSEVEVSTAEPPLRNMVGMGSGAGLGTLFLGGKIRHDFAFLNFQYGRLLERTFADETAWQGRWMIMGELTVGREIQPGDALVISATPTLRYQFERSGEIIPFIEGGYGITWTDIRAPDLGGDQQFNGHLGAGVYWFAKPNLAYSLQYRFVHYSNAGTRSPNSGVNINAILLGVSYFY